jgi:hypothetical protein
VHLHDIFAFGTFKLFRPKLLPPQIPANLALLPSALDRGTALVALKWNAPELSVVYVNCGRASATRTPSRAAPAVSVTVPLRLIS